MLIDVWHVWSKRSQSVRLANYKGDQKRSDDEQASDFGGGSIYTSERNHRFVINRKGSC
jgi:hypothetical protein